MRVSPILSEGILTAHWGRFENCGTEPETLPVGNTKGTVAASSGLETAVPVPSGRGMVVVGSNTSPTAEHCAPVMLSIPFHMR